MYYDIIKLLNLEQFNVKFKKLETVKENNVLYCHLTLEKAKCSCPDCGSLELYVHDYRTKKIKHSISTNNPCYFIYRARRYRCSYCSTIFYEHNPFSLKNDKNSIYTTVSALNALKSHTATFTDVASNFNLTKTTVIRIFDQYVICSRKVLPKVICFDEAYTSRKSYQKYAFIMVDFFSNEVVDVFPSKHKYR